MLDGKLHLVDDMERKVAQFLAESKDVFSGAYLVQINGALRLRGAVGLANREFEVANLPSTRFRIGSVTKQFTAATILLLAEEQSLALDDSVARFLPKTGNVWRDVTIRMLLCHRSGIPDYTSLERFPSKISKINRNPMEIIELMSNLPLDFTPGTNASYSNSGYTALGCVIEEVCAQTYAEALQSRLFDPLGMSSTGYDNGVSLVPWLASGYAFDDQKWSRAEYIAMSLPFAAGGLYSTVDLPSGNVLCTKASYFAMTHVKPCSPITVTA
jgi:D-alanyl-D-alanine carboxypeptidase